ncbi:MAG: PAS domain S-box protein [Deltaproteobacteria bacterium]|nr:PAS domain S-box protein [Deltaproteobacteria bacterium]
MTDETVKVPEQLNAVFVKAQQRVREYFEKYNSDPSQGTIEISGERYILVRAASLSTEFFDLVASLQQNLSREQARKVAAAFLFDLGHAIGKADASHFHEQLGISDPVERLSDGPVHFAYSGWAFVDILPDSNPSPDDDYFLVYDHPHSFEADTWLDKNKPSDHPVCIMNAGYSSGWCENSFGIPLVAAEIECRAKGDKHCRFVMAKPSKINEFIARYKAKAGEVPEQSLSVDLPAFFHSDHLRQELQRERDFSSVILNTVAALVVVLDSEGKIVGFNRACEKTTGYAVSEVHGQRIQDLFLIAEEADSVLEVIEKVSRGEKIDRQENTWQTKDGQHRLIRWLYTTLTGSGGLVDYIVCTGIDVTKHLRMERQLAKQIGELAQVNQRLAEVNTELDSFAYSVSHDLRTPLRAMEGFAQALLENYADNLDPEGQEFTRRIVSTARHMDILIQDLLGYSRVSRAEIEHEPVDLEMLVADVLLQLEAQMKEKKAKVSVQKPLPAVLGHRAILLQVVENLLANAIKFVAPGIHPRVEVSAVQHNGRTRLWVSDNGIGIDPRHHELIFRVLERLHDIESYPGTGIGLAMVKKGIQRLGGQLGVESKIGAGSRFWIELPTSPAQTT